MRSKYTEILKETIKTFQKNVLPLNLPEKRNNQQTPICSALTPPPAVSTELSKCMVLKGLSLYPVYSKLRACLLGDLGQMT